MKLKLYYVVRPNKESNNADCTLVGGPYSSWKHADAARGSELSSDGMEVVEHTVEVAE